VESFPRRKQEMQRGLLHSDPEEDGYVQNELQRRVGLGLEYCTRKKSLFEQRKSMRVMRTHNTKQGKKKQTKYVSTRSRLLQESKDGESLCQKLEWLRRVSFHDNDRCTCHDADPV
jgi:hypothetical protein